MPKKRAHGGAWVLAGLLLLAAALLVLVANERQVGAWDRGLARHGGVLDQGAAARPADGQYGHLARVTGTPKVVVAPRDPAFGVQVSTTRLLRTVEMFQWREVRVGTDVHYEQDWVDHAVDSHAFARPVGHVNPGSLPFASMRFVAPEVRLGGYRLAPDLVHALPLVTHAVPVSLARLPPNLAATLRDDHGTLTTTPAGQSPQLGDLRIGWRAADLRPATVVARVDGDRLVADAGGKDAEVQDGTRSLADVLTDLPAVPHAVWTWRLVSLLAGWAGMVLLLRGTRRKRADAVAALALAVFVLAVAAGLVWIGVSRVAGIGLLVLAALGLGIGWRRLA